MNAALCIIISTLLLFTPPPLDNSRSVNCKEQLISIQSLIQKEFGKSIHLNLDEEVDEKIIYHLAKELYLSGAWDGTPAILCSHKVSFGSRTGHLLVDDYLVSDFQEVIDLPDPFDDTFDSRHNPYIPNQGVYAIKDSTLVKYVRGKMISLGNPLTWKGLNVQNPSEYGCTIVDDTICFPDSTREYLYEYKPYLYYVEDANKLLMVTIDPISKLMYLYVFPDYNVSEIQYLETICDFAIFGSSSLGFHFYYLDRNGMQWIYTKNGPRVDSLFVK